ncbi:hypothetical protein ACIQ6Y_19030 [Streptomyces sp. NPDC096205]|uniref:hypothetical protein n=1 Tax=Streptomyces sp. NPDC096205 TaxID=3366081 RepID=UPI0038227D67
MHRTTTTATLLVTVAVSALTGCVTVQRPPASGPPVAPTQPSVPRPDGHTEPQIVQAPAREALELAGRRPSTPPRSSTPPTPSPQIPAPRHAPAETPPAPRAEHPGRPHPHPHPEKTRHARPHVPPAGIPDVSESVRKNTDVCALGKKYGGWRADSPEARACERAYGR